MGMTWDPTRVTLPYYDLTALSSLDSFYSGSSTEEPVGMAWKPDGTKVFVARDDSDEIFSYTLSTAYDITTASFADTFAVGSQTSDTDGVGINGDGTKLYVPDTAGTLYSYSLSTAYDVSTASSANSLDVSGQETGFTGMSWNDDGTKLYITGYISDSVHSYTLTTAYDITTASYSNSFAVSGEESGPTGLTWKPDGTKLYVIGQGSASVHSYSLSTAYDITTASPLNSFDVSGDESNPQGVTWNDVGSKLYMVGEGGSQTLYSYTIN